MEKEKFIKNNDKDKSEHHFDVIGAGKIRISESANYQIGNSLGFDFGVEWGELGYAGGVLTQHEARKLAEFILDKLGVRPIKVWKK